MLAFYGSGPRRGFITRWTVAGDATARTITLPLSNSNSSAFNCTVNWGDGSGLSTVTAYNDADRIHTYTADGTYDVEICGQCEGWSFNNGGDKLKLVAVVNWGSVGVFSGFKYMAAFLYGCSNCSALPIGGHIISAGALSLDSAFRMTAITNLYESTFAKMGTVTSLYAMCDGCTNLVTVAVGAFSKCPLVTTVAYCFRNCRSLTGNVTGLFRYMNNLMAAFSAFDGCLKLSCAADEFYDSGEQGTRFLNVNLNFSSLHARVSFSGNQGVAPELWNCDYGETITLDVGPATDWAGGDVITGQSSGAVATVVAKVSTLVYKIKKHFGTFTLGEVVGVTGTPAKLADQGAANPTFAGTPVSTGCFGGAGNSIASLSNYADIPASWK